MEDDSVRLQVLLAEAGVGSRRHCERLIADGRVRVNGAVADRLGTKASRRASVEVDGKPLASPSGKTYIMLNKPKGYISSAKDQFGRKTVFDLVAVSELRPGLGPESRPESERELKPGARLGVGPELRTELVPESQQGLVPESRPESALRLFSVGRLDCDTTGLLLLTNDGEFANRVAHPSGEIEKTYEAVVHAPATPEMLDRLRNGVQLGDGSVTSPARVWAGCASDEAAAAGGPDGSGGGADGLSCGDGGRSGGNDSASGDASQSGDGGGADGLNCGDGGWSGGNGGQNDDASGDASQSDDGGSADGLSCGDGGRSGGNGGASGDASQSGDGGSADGLNCGSGGQSDDGGRADARNGGCEIGDSQSAPSHYRVTVAIREGKNRQVRRMLAAVGLRTDALKRVAIGGLALGDLAEGAWRRISRDDAMSAIFGQRTAR